MKSKKSTSDRMKLPTIIFIVFLTLKLTNCIDWSWLWVTAPLWIPFALTVFFIILLYLGIVLK